MPDQMILGQMFLFISGMSPAVNYRKAIGAKFRNNRKMDELSEVIREVLRQCVEQGMQPPFILCVVSPNGSVMVMRTDGEHPEILAEHTEGAGFSTPINCMVVDRAGAAAHITIEPSGATSLH